MACSGVLPQQMQKQRREAGSLSGSVLSRVKVGVGGEQEGKGGGGGLADD